LTRAALLSSAALALGLSLAAGPALARSGVGQDGVHDPFEGLNRFFFAVQTGLDKAIIRPGAVFFKHAVPRPVRSGLGHFISNLGEPIVAANDLLQGRGSKAGETVARFAVNSTVGIGGLFDVATGAHLPHHANDFGLTLARYGVQSGPYLFIPLIGPTNVRDGIGGIANIALNPLTYAGYPGQAQLAAGTTVVGGLGARASVDGQLKAMNASAIDPYATMRAYAEQNRQAEIRNGVVEIQTLPDFDDDSAVPQVSKVAMAAGATGGAP
jgi:phospholipid-binding lipoprotein MlaA